jgi:branched-subunit amino acid ABC-type transport system permease component
LAARWIIGRQMRAVAQNRDAAEIMGLNSEWVILITITITVTTTTITAAGTLFDPARGE